MFLQDNTQVVNFEPYYERSDFMGGHSLNARSGAQLSHSILLIDNHRQHFFVLDTTSVKTLSYRPNWL